MARSKEGVPTPFCYTLCYFYKPELLITFFDLILNSELDNSSKKEILAMRLPDKNDNMSCLAFALYFGQTAFVESHLRQILTSGLDEQSKIELLHAKGSSGTSAMQRAIKGGHEKTIICYGQTIIDAAGLTPETKLMLLESLAIDAPLTDK